MKKKLDDIIEEIIEVSDKEYSRLIAENKENKNKEEFNREEAKRKLAKFYVLLDNAKKNKHEVILELCDFLKLDELKDEYKAADDESRSRKVEQR